MAAVLKEVPPDPDYVRRCYDEALGYARFVEKRINDAMVDVVRIENFPALVSARLGNLRGLINDFAQANYTLLRAYLNLCEVMDWDDDDAKAAGVAVREVRL